MNTKSRVPKAKTTNKKIHWKSGPAIKQYLPFPDTLIYYITTNPISAKAYDKIIQCCKYFFDANPIIVVRQICEHCDYDYGMSRICSKERSRIDHLIQKCCMKVDLRKISCKIWLTNRLIIGSKIIPIFTLFFRPKLYRYEIVELELCSSTLAFKDFKYLIQTVRRLEFNFEVKIFYSDGNTVMLDKVLEVCSKIEEFSFDFTHSTDFPMITASTLKDISKLQNLTNLKNFEMYRLPEIFNEQDIFDFLAKNFLDTKIKLFFDTDVTANYMSQLYEIRLKLRKLQVQNHSLLYCGEEEFFFDGNMVKFDEILEVCPKIKEFSFIFSDSTDAFMFASSTLRDISSLPNLTNLKFFKMFCVSEIFNIRGITDFLTMDLMNTNIRFHFHDHVSPGYKIQLRAINEKIRELNIKNHIINHFGF